MLAVHQKLNEAMMQYSKREREGERFRAVFSGINFAWRIGAFTRVAHWAWLLDVAIFLVEANDPHILARGAGVNWTGLWRIYYQRVCSNNNTTCCLCLMLFDIEHDRIILY